MKKIFFITSLFIIPFVFASCNVGTYGGWKNDHIDANIRSEISQLDQKLFKALTNKDEDGVKQLMSNPLKEKLGKKLDTIVNFAAQLKTSEYRILDEYYVKNTSTGLTNVVFPDKVDHNAYKIQYLAINKEAYVSLMITKNLPINCLITAIYGKYDHGWKVNVIHIGEYEVFDKTGPDYYRQAVQEYKKENFINAMGMMYMAKEVAEPAGDFFKYNAIDSMKKLYENVITAANTKYKFPFAVTGVKTSPLVFGVRPQFINGEGDHKGAFPIIVYKSTIPLTDTVALKAENLQMQKQANNIFKGIEQNTYIFYQAYNQIPDGKTQVEHYGFVQKVK